jgi:NAD-dependent protein deacetylase/lipoamidase
VANTLPIARRAGARIVIMNAEETPFDELADAVVRRPIGTTLPQMLA